MNPGHEAPFAPFDSAGPLSLRIHADASRDRARVMGHLFSRFIAKLKAPRLPAFSALRWG
jgi:hypothetical protein